jgi:MFS superfamily sulfate permease-like transporter
LLEPRGKSRDRAEQLGHQPNLQVALRDEGGPLSFASANGLVYQFSYAGDLTYVVIDMAQAQIWDASTVAALTGFTTKYASSGMTVTIVNLNEDRAQRHELLAGQSCGGHCVLAAAWCGEHRVDDPVPGRRPAVDLVQEAFSRAMNSSAMSSLRARSSRRSTAERR